MCKTGIKCRNFLKPLISLALLLFYFNSFSQPLINNDSIAKIRSGPLFESANNRSLFFNVPSRDPSSLVPSSLENITDRNLMFYDSLIAKASKTPLKKKLYAFVIVRPETLNSKQIINASDSTYFSYSGKKIRNISIEKLNVFGTNINDHDLSEPKKLENLLNKTHINTLEFIIRKNLLFSEGDSISPLTLSDNERILRQLPYIDDARIIVIPVSDDESDILVLTKDVYSLGGSFSYKGLEKGTVSVFEKNVFGIGHELGIDIPYDNNEPNSPGFGFHYRVTNIASSFISFNGYYLNGLGDLTYGLSLNRKLVSSATKYAGGISVIQMYTSVKLNPLSDPEPLKYNLQDYYVLRSFLVNKESVSRIIIGARYTNNNVFERPLIEPDAYYALQKYNIILGSVAYSVQKYYKTKLIYSYGRAEDVPYGGLFKFTMGKENNEFKERTYIGGEFSLGKSNRKLGYFYGSAGVSTYFNMKHSEQGIFFLNMKYFSNLVDIRKSQVRNFINIDYTKGFDRNTDEYLNFSKENGFSGFRNDSARGAHRLTLSLESVVFRPGNFYGFRFALFGFTDFSYLTSSNQLYSNGLSLVALGFGIRVRNDNLVFNTLQIRIGFYPNPPQYSRLNFITISGEKLLSPDNFDPGPPTVIPYR